MALIDVARFTATSSGTGDFVVSSAVTGYQTPAAAGAVNGATYSYRAENPSLSEWEVGFGTYTTGTTTLARSTVLYNSLGTTAKISFTAAPQVAVVALTRDIVSSMNGAAGAIVTDLHALQNASLAVSASAGALTISLNDASGATPSAGSPVAVNFRSATATTGSYSTLSVNGSTSLTLPSSSTLGILSATACRIWIVLFNDAGTARLGAINCFDRNAISFTGLNEGLASSTAVSAAATAAKTFYTGTAVTSKPYRILGYIEWSATGMTAGTWTTTNLLLVQSYGAGCYKPGDVIKTERGTTSTQFNTTSSTYQTTNLSAAITPMSAANMVSAAFMGTLYNRSQTGESCFASLFRGSTQIGPESEGYARNNDVIVISSGLTDDAPNTTASTTYSVKIRNSAGTANMGFPDGGRLAEIRLTEVMT